MSETRPERRNVWLTRCWHRPEGPSWLALDLTGGDKIVELAGPESLAGQAPGSILVSFMAQECAGLPGGGLLIPEGVLWAFLDPREPRVPLDTAGKDRLALESSLRRQGQRFRRQVAWWQHLPGALKANCQDLLRGFTPQVGQLLEQFDVLPSVLCETDKVREASERTPAEIPEVLSAPLKSPDIYAWFTSPDGLGSFYGPHFTPRPEQAEMAREVAQALEDGEPLLVEAGTGVGKTLAYLVPLLAAQTVQGGRAAVSTHTRALQSQILDQDLPRLQALLEGRKAALLMGRRNYLCLRQRLSFASRPVTHLIDGLQAVAFRLWLHETRDGMREELAGNFLLERESRALFDAADLCLPGQCYEGHRCFVQKARQTAREADLLVVNHSLLMHDMLADNTLLGEINHLVVDEAHRLPEVVLDTHGIGVGNWRIDEIEELLGRVKGRPGALVRLQLVANRLQGYGTEGGRAAAAAEDLEVVCRRALKSFGAWWKKLGARVDEEMKGAGPHQGKVRVRDKDEAFGSIRPQTVALLEDLAEAGEAMATLGRRTGVLDDLSTGLEDDLAQIGQAGQLLRRLYTDITFLTSHPDEDWVTWLDPGPRGGLRSLGATLLEAGSVLRRYWQDAERAPIMTSATLAVGEDFTHMMSELGLTRRRPATRTFTSPSPFDHHRQMKILSPAHFPGPQAHDFGRAVGEILAQVGQKLGRKTLGLFTSFRLIKEAAQVLQDAGLDPGGQGVSPHGVPFFTQQSGVSVPHLLAGFRAAPQAVLLGTNTFWEGVDFPGEDLEILVVTKLPFLVPNDPWVEARCEKLAAAGENPFTSFMVRDAVLRLRQGVGRLLRRSSDKGVVILLDNRLHTKNYGVTFLGALPVIPESFSDTGDLLDRLQKFFNTT
jgi:Rad3-related DNA helicase